MTLALNTINRRSSEYTLHLEMSRHCVLSQDQLPICTEPGVPRRLWLYDFGPEMSDAECVVSQDPIPICSEAGVPRRLSLYDFGPETTDDKPIFPEPGVPRRIFLY